MSRVTPLLVFVYLLVGCASDPTVGYSSQSLYPKQWRTVAVPIFDNDTMSRDLEFMLTDAVIKQVQSRTPYRIATEKRADTLLTGTVRKVELRQLSQSRLTGLSEEVLVNVTIDFEWIDLRTGRRILGRENFGDSGLFVPSQPSSEPLAVGEFAVVQELATDIVDEMQAAW